VFGGRLDYTRRNLQRRHPQCGNDIINIQAANVVCAEHALTRVGRKRCATLGDGASSSRVHSQGSSADGDPSGISCVSG